jgi:lipoprotein-releasing system permease protein
LAINPNMYQLLLIFKYLRRKLAPMFAASAVMLCTAMVIIVISVMGGFLENLRASAHRLTGDVIIEAGSMTGFPHYETLIEQITELPEVEAATPVINTYGLIKLQGRIKTVQVQGVLPKEFDRIVPYRQTLYWSAQDLLDDFDTRDGQESDEILVEYRKLLAATDLVEYGMTLEPPDYRKQRAEREDLAGIVIGIEVSISSQRGADGQYHIRRSALEEDLLLTVLPISEKGSVQQTKAAPMAVLNEFKSGLLEVDARNVFVRFDVLQNMLSMDTAPAYDDNGVATGKMLPGRTTEILAKAAKGYTADQARDAVEVVAAQFVMIQEDTPYLYVMTWEQKYQHLLGAVQNEKGMVTFLFMIISVVAIVMVATTFYMIVLEKTRDIGVLRALGASRFGVMNIFLGYGLAVGVIGSLLGLALAVLVVKNLNVIHSFLANSLGVTLLLVVTPMLFALITTIVFILIRFSILADKSGRDASAELLFVALGQCRGQRFYLAILAAGIGGILLAYLSLIVVPAWANWLSVTISWQMWDPRVYYFDRIPEAMSLLEVSLIVIGAIVSSVIGALIPALLAGRLDPIEALRYE